MPGGGSSPRAGAGPVTDLKVALHIFLIVLVLGTGWKLAALHLTVSSNAQVSHLGKAMLFQYGA
jgi:hypothetical protein